MGAACARELAARGYRVSLLARSPDVEALARELGGGATRGDVDSADDLERFVHETIAAYGRIDAVVNNTGNPPKGPLLELTDGDWHAGLDMLLLNVARVARLVTPAMRAQGGGAFVNISTFAGGGRFATDYYATTMRVGANDVAVDSAGYVYISGGNIIHKVSPTGLIAKVVGNPGACCEAYFAGDGGLATLALVYGVRAIDLDANDNLLIADSSNNRIRRAQPSGPIPQPVGTNVLSPAETYPVPTNALAIATGDFTGDGRNDIAVAVAG